MIPLRIYWHHVGREHDASGYTTTIQKNAPDLVERCLRAKEDSLRASLPQHRFVQHDADTLIELPPENSARPFIIVYCRDQGLQYSQGYKNHPGWLIDVVDIEERAPGLFCVHDLFVDVLVNADGSYQVQDVDEFADAVRLGVLDAQQTARALVSLHTALAALNAHQFPSKRLKQIMQTYLLDTSSGQGGN